MKLRRPSPALVVSIIALVVASASTAYAAVRITSSKQIKTGVVNSGDIRNGTIQNRDIKKNTISTSRLTKGTLQRIVGSGAPGEGVGTALEAIRKAGPENQPANVVVKVASLSVPAGAYQVTAKTVMTAFTGTTNVFESLTDAPASLGGHCKLDAAGDVDESVAPIVIRNRPAPATLVMQLTRTVGATSNIDLLCDAGAVWRTSDTSIIARRMGSVSRSESTG